MFGHRAAIRLRSALIWLCLLALTSLALAQGSATPIQIGQNAVGQLSADATTAQYALTATGGENVTVQALAITAGFVPSFTVTNPAGVEIVSLANTGAQTSISASVSLDDAGVYTIAVTGANGTLGQFLLSVQAGAPLPSPVDLTPDQPISDSVSSDTPVRVYRFSTSSAAPSLLTVLSSSPDAGLLVSLYDEDTNRTVATSDAAASGIAYRFTPQQGHYHIEVRASGASGDAAFTICLGDCGAGLLASQATSVVTATVAADQAACAVASSTGGSVNVRSGPGTQYAIVGALPGGQSAPVLGQFTGGGWYEISFSGGVGWVAGSVTQVTGDCTALTQVAAPIHAPLAPTFAPPTAPPAAAPTSAPSSGGAPNPTATTAPTAIPTTASSASSLPDLVVAITSVTYDHGGVTINYTVSNAGAPNDMSGNIIDIQVCASTTCQVGNTGGDAMPVSEGYFIAISLPPDMISIPVSVTVDYDNLFKESNENNNTATSSVVVHPVSISPHG